ncbi:Sucrase/ferredoxin-like-domain-containing protein [Russula ochroleuca]|uniref:Sucrase/ferredoxin-like-domain-containing protein n=1 Tax=Russula ochroleuca TaxID=152965 RepID=A0A9P5TCW0_9AGAM|nr:Sucrase/ferredoxin-like-domain-containing protein [Russula ochroleuca]
MNRLKRLAAILLSPTEDLEQAHAALEAAGVPVSFADCRNCPNPCEDGKQTHSSIPLGALNRVFAGHEEYPQKIASMIDTTSDMLGSVKPYRRQVVISTGKSDWGRSVTDEKDSLASYISAIEKASAPLVISPGGTSAPGTPPGTPGTPVTPTTPQQQLLLPPAVAGIFKDSENHAVAILNGSHDTLSKSNDHETVLVFPDYKVLTEVPRSLDGARELWRNSVNPSVPRLGYASTETGTSVRSWVIPYTCVILICSHRRRDVRCAVVAPKLEHAFSQTLQAEGWDVHTQLEDPTGSPLEDYPEGDEKEAEFSRRLQELDEGLPKRALVLKTSHIGGHKYAGNVIIYMPQGAGVWYGRVSTHEVASIVHTTILGGRILPPLLRGGVNLARPDCKRLNDW